MPVCSALRSWVSSVAHSATAGVSGAHVLAVTVRDTAMGLSGPIPVDVSHIEATCSASFWLCNGATVRMPSRVFLSTPHSVQVSITHRPE